MARTNIDPALRDVPPFSDCSSRELRLIAPLVTTAEVPAHHVLMREGDPADGLVVVVAGLASVQRDGRELAELTRGDVIGELSMLVGAPRTATVVAKTSMTLARLSPGSFARLLDECPTVAQAVLRTAIHRLAPAA
jgi:CRP-like cAMP-binding protein